MHVCEKYATTLRLSRLRFSTYMQDIARHSYVKAPTIQAVDM